MGKGNGEVTGGRYHCFMVRSFDFTDWHYCCCCFMEGYSILHQCSSPLFSTTWLTHTVNETKGYSPYNGWLVRFIGLGLGLYQEYVNHVVEKAVRYPNVTSEGHLRYIVGGQKYFQKMLPGIRVYQGNTQKKREKRGPHSKKVQKTKTKTKTNNRNC